MDKTIAPDFPVFGQYITFACILVLSSILTIVVAIYQRSKKNRGEITVPIIFYSSATILQIIPVLLSLDTINFKIFESEKFHLVTSNLFMLTEFIIFSILLISMIRSKKTKIVLRILTIVFPIYSLFHWLFIHKISYNPYELSLVEIALLLPVIVLFFLEIFQSPTTRNLFKEPHFWIASGLLIYCLSVLPNFLVFSLVVNSDAWTYETLLYSSLLFSIALNGFFIKAMLCKITQS